MFCKSNSLGVFSGQSPTLKFGNLGPFLKSIGSHLIVNVFKPLTLKKEIDPALQRDLKLRHYSGEMLNSSSATAVNVSPCQMDWVHPVVARQSVNSASNASAVHTESVLQTYKYTHSAQPSDMVKYTSTCAVHIVHPVEDRPSVNGAITPAVKHTQLHTQW